MNDLPSEYHDYINSGQPSCGFTDLDFSGYFDLEPLSQIETLNRDIQIDKYAPGYLAFASNGGGEVLAFDSQGKIYSIPLVGISCDSAVLVAESWSDFAQHIETEK